MERTNKDSKTLFDLGAYNSLMESIAKAAANGDPDAKDDLRILKRATDSWHGYVSTVDMTETRIKVARFKTEGEELREIIEEADKARRRLQEAAISNAAMINRYCTFYGVVGKIFLGDISDREEVADFCLDVTNALFKEAREVA